MNTNNKTDKSYVDLKAIGNYTKDAVENFENHIVQQHNYLEKVDDKLKNTKSNKNP